MTLPRPQKLTLYLTLCVFLTGWGCLRSPRQTVGDAERDPLMVYCAAGIRLPVEQAAKQYEAEFGQPVQIDYGSSGELEGRLEIDRRSGKSRCDLYVPADFSFSDRTRQKGLTSENLPLAQFRLVLGMKTNSESNYTTVQQLVDSGDGYIVCDTKAGAGKKTMKILQQHGLWELVDQQKKATFPRVPEAANAIKTADDIAAGFIWDTTAKQFGLKAIVPVEIEDAVSSVGVNLVASSTRPTDALRFARYLSAIDGGQQFFKKHGFVPAGTDRWAESPEIVLYCGGVNRNAIDKTLREFEAREGVTVKEHYGGCGTLVTGINSAAGAESRKGMPDVFMTCDASYLTKVEQHFAAPTDVSSTGIVMLVRKGNPKQLTKIADLANPDLSIGTTNPKMSTLGDLTWQIFEVEGIKDEIEANKSISVLSPTAHELILQMTSHDKLDVVLVYEANCQNLPDSFEFVRLEHELAVAVQNIATARATPYPALVSRLIEAVHSATSRKRFEMQGFQWRAQPMTQ